MGFWSKVEKQVRGYPHKGQYIEATYIARGKPKVIKGILKSVATVRSGAVLGFIETDSGKVKSVPWSLSRTKFKILS